MLNEIAVELRIVDDQKSTRATANVTFDTSHGELTIARIRVIHKEDKEPWISFPDISFPDRENSGKYVHLDIVKPGARLKKAISDAVLEEYEKAAAK